MMYVPSIVFYCNHDEFYSWLCLIRLFFCDALILISTSWNYVNLRIFCYCNLISEKLHSLHTICYTFPTTCNCLMVRLFAQEVPCFKPTTDWWCIRFVQEVPWFKPTTHWWCSGFVQEVPWLKPTTHWWCSGLFKKCRGLSQQHIGGAAVCWSAVA